MKSHHEISIPYETLVRFLESAEGNYRNALYIRCSACRYHREEHCGDFLFIPGHDCVPILFPLADAMDVIGHIDPSDCAGILSSTAFLHLYHQWLILLTNMMKSVLFIRFSILLIHDCHIMGNLFLIGTAFTSSLLQKKIPFFYNKTRQYTNMRKTI